MSSPPPLGPADVIGPLAGALAFVVVMSLVREPARRELNAVLVAGASGVYLSGGLGRWEVLFAAVVVTVAYLGLRSYRFIGLGWFLHAGLDLIHHRNGHPIWPFMPTSSFGCLIFDAAIALWFVAGAPALVRRRSARGGPADHAAR